MNTLNQMPTLDIRNCHTCGSEVTANFRYCRYCGASQMAEPTSYLSMEDKPVSETDMDRATGASIEKITLIMVDDHLVVRHGSQEFQAIQSEREESVARCQEYAPNVTLMDMMPKIGGGEATRQVRQVSSPTQIIILTSLPSVAISLSYNRGHFNLKCPTRKS